MNYKKRRSKLRKLLGKNDGILITDESNVRYLTGFTGDSTYLVVYKGDDTAALLISDPRYEEQISRQCDNIATYIRRPSDLLLDATCEQIMRLGLQTLIFEPSLAYGSHKILSEKLELRDLVAGAGEVEKLRTIKDGEEVAVIEKAVAIAERAFQTLRYQLRPNLTERELAHSLEDVMRKLGAEGCSFPPIVAVGANGALPHYEPGYAQVGDAPTILIDWGATYAGYRSDLTRVLTTTRRPSNKFQRAYEAVLCAQEAAIAAVRPGITGCEVDAIAREALAAARVEKRFNHGLGHGIGLDIHESTRLGKNFPQPLQAGMVITIEPGVYYPGEFGIRIEDDVLVTATGARVLSSIPKDLGSCLCLPID